MKLQNVMEDFVAQKLEEVIDDLDCCKCGQCREDIISYALNRLTPKYVNTEKGKVFVKVDTMSNQFEIDILTAIYEGAAIVKKHPRHSSPEK
jgi:competence protein ComFB